MLTWRQLKRFVRNVPLITTFHSLTFRFKVIAEDDNDDDEGDDDAMEGDGDGEGGEKKEGGEKEKKKEYEDDDAGYEPVFKYDWVY